MLLTWANWNCLLSKQLRYKTINNKLEENQAVSPGYTQTDVSCRIKTGPDGSYDISNFGLNWPPLINLTSIFVEARGPGLIYFPPDQIEVWAGGGWGLTSRQAWGRTTLNDDPQQSCQVISSLTPLDVQWRQNLTIKTLKWPSSWSLGK